MGCVSSRQYGKNNPTDLNYLRNWQRYAEQNQKPVLGILTISIPSCFLQSCSSFSNSPYIIVNVSNQCFKRKIKKKGRVMQISNEKFQIAINSLKKIYGRTLIIQVSFEDIQKESEIGLGVVDLDFYLKFVNYSNQERCFINYGKKAAGYVNLQFNFRENQFLFCQNLISNKENIFFLDTIAKQSSKNQTIQYNPEDGQQILYFKVPYIIKSGLIQLIQPTQSGLVIIGQTKLSLQRFSSKVGQYSYIQNIFNQEQLGGTICFDAIKDPEKQYKFIDCQMILSVMNRKTQTINFTQVTQMKSRKKSNNNQVIIPLQRWSSMGSSLKRFIPKKMKEEETLSKKKQRIASILQVAQQNNTKLFQVNTPTTKSKKMIQSDPYLNRSKRGIRQLPPQIQQTFQIQSQSGMDVSVANIKINMLDDDNTTYREDKDYAIEISHANKKAQDSVVVQNYPRVRRNSQYLEGIDLSDKVCRKLESGLTQNQSPIHTKNKDIIKQARKNSLELRIQQINKLNLDIYSSSILSKRKQKQMQNQNQENKINNSNVSCFNKNQMRNIFNLKYGTHIVNNDFADQYFDTQSVHAFDDTYDINRNKNKIQSPKFHTNILPINFR